MLEITVYYNYDYDMIRIINAFPEFDKEKPERNCVSKIFHLIRKKVQKLGYAAYSFEPAAEVKTCSK